jgi:hypothetical protein
MSFFVSVRFKADPKLAHDVLRENPDLEQAVLKGIYEHGLVGCQRLVGDGEFIDIDEWPSETERDAFVAAAGPALKKWNELMGYPETETHTWRSATEDEIF